jgi:hypothetical protein
MSNLSDWKEILAGWEDDMEGDWKAYCDAVALAAGCLNRYRETCTKVWSLRDKVSQMEKEQADVQV